MLQQPRQDLLWDSLAYTLAHSAWITSDCNGSISWTNATLQAVTPSLYHVCFSRHLACPSKIRHSNWAILNLYEWIDCWSFSKMRSIDLWKPLHVFLPLPWRSLGCSWKSGRAGCRWAACLPSCVPARCRWHCWAWTSPFPRPCTVTPACRGFAATAQTQKWKI